MKFSAAAMISLTLLLMNASSVSATQFLTSVDPRTGATVIAVARGSGAGSGTATGSNAGTFTDVPSSGFGYANIVEQLSQSTKDRELLENLLQTMSRDRAIMEAIARAIAGGDLASDAILRIAKDRGLAGAADAERARQEEAQKQLAARVQLLEAMRRQQQEQAERARQEQERIAAAAAARQQEMLKLIARQSQEAAWRQALDDAREKSVYGLPDGKPHWEEVGGRSAHYKGGATAYLSSGGHENGHVNLWVDFGSREITGDLTFDSTILGMVGSANVGLGQNAMSGILHVSPDSDGVFGGSAISRGDWQGEFGGLNAEGMNGLWRVMVSDGPNAGVAYGDFGGGEDGAD